MLYGFLAVTFENIDMLAVEGKYSLVISLGIKNVVDDTLDVFACHGISGLVGMVLTGIFAKDGGLITGSSELFFKHLVAAAGVSAFAFVMSLIIYKIVSLLTPLYHDGTYIDGDYE